MLTTLARFPRLSRYTRLYIWTWGCLGFAYFGIYSVLFNLYLLRLGYGTEAIGLLAASGQIAWAVTSIPAGILGARFGNRNCMIVGLLIAAVATALLLFAQEVPGPLLTKWIAVWTIVSWSGIALLAVNGSPFLMGVCTPTERGDAFSLNQAMIGISGLAGSLVAGVLPGLFAAFTGESMESATVYRDALWLVPLFYFAAVLVMMSTKQKSTVNTETKSSHDEKFPLFLILFVGVIYFLMTSGEGTLRSFFNVYLDTGLDVRTSLIGVVIGSAQVLPIFLALVAPLVLTKWGTGRTVVFAGIANIAFLSILALFSSWFAASIGYIGALLIISLADIALNIFSQELVNAQWRTAIATSASIGIAIGWSSTAGIGGFVIANYGYDALFLWGAVTSALYGLLMWWFLKSVSRQKSGVLGAVSPTD